MAPLHVQLSWVATITWFALLILFVLNVAHCAASVKKKSCSIKSHKNQQQLAKNAVWKPGSSASLGINAPSFCCICVVLRSCLPARYKVRDKDNKNLAGCFRYRSIRSGWEHASLSLLPIDRRRWYCHTPAFFFFVLAPLKPSPFDLINRVGSMIRSTPMDC